MDSTPQPPVPAGGPIDQPAAGPPKERPKWKHVIIMTLGGIALAVGGCGAFLSGLNDTNALSILGGIGFVAGVILFCIGAITGIVYIVTAIFRSGKS